MKSNNQNSRFLHHLRYKTEYCRNVTEHGSCRYGNKCQFAHSGAELRPLITFANRKLFEHLLTLRKCSGESENSSSDQQDGNESEDTSNQIGNNGNDSDHTCRNHEDMKSKQIGIHGNDAEHNPNESVGSDKSPKLG